MTPGTAETRQHTDQPQTDVLDLPARHRASWVPRSQQIPPRGVVGLVDVTASETLIGGAEGRPLWPRPPAQEQSHGGKRTGSTPAPRRLPPLVGRRASTPSRQRPNHVRSGTSSQCASTCLLPVAPCRAPGTVSKSNLSILGLLSAYGCR
jgi:hypothetical protein